MPFEDSVPITGVAGDAHGAALVARNDVELVKLDTAGARLWSKPWGAKVLVGQGGRLFVAGTFAGTLTADDLTFASAGGRDVFVLELDEAGRVLAGQRFGGEADEQLTSFAIGPEDELVLSGPGLGTTLVRDRTIIWQKPYVGHAALDAQGNTVLTGALEGSIDFGGGVLTSAGQSDVFLVQLGPAGQHRYSRSFGNPGQASGSAVATDSSSNVFVSGTFEGSLDFGVGPLTLDAGACPAEAWCKAGGFIARFDAQGQTIWSVQTQPLRDVTSAVSHSDGRLMVSGALPGGVTPFHVPWLVELDHQGRELWRRAEWPETGLGMGGSLALDQQGGLLWALSVLPSLGSEERTYLAKFSP